MIQDTFFTAETIKGVFIITEMAMKNPILICI